MATLINKRKLAAVSTETPDSSRGSKRRNVLDPELTQDYISQVSEEIEGRVTKKLSKDFNKTESRILGALSKPDEFLLNPQVWTCSVFQGASRNANSESREFHGDRSSTDPYPEGGIFLTTRDNSTVLRQTWWRKPILTWWQELQEKFVTILTCWQEVQKRFVTTLTRWQHFKKRFSSALLLLRQANRRRRAPQLNLNSAVRIPLRQLKLTTFCWPFNNWRRTPIQPISTKILAEFRNCLNPSQRRCLRLMANQRNSNCLKIYSKRVRKSTISWRKKTR